MAGERPVKAAMPHSCASLACSVYQAACARKKLPTPRCTIRTGAAGRPSVARRRRRNPALLEGSSSPGASPAAYPVVWSVVTA